MSMIIQGPKQPGNDMDVYFHLLIEELLTMLVKEPAVKCYDADKKEIFDPHVMLLHTIQDMTALGNTLGQKTKGDVGCVTCMDRTASRRLPNSCQTVYLRHRRFLRKNHPYRKMKAEFDGTAKVGVGPRPYDGEVVHNMAKKINGVLGKNHPLTVKQTPRDQVFKKKLVF